MERRRVDLRDGRGVARVSAYPVGRCTNSRTGRASCLPSLSSRPSSERTLMAGSSRARGRAHDRQLGTSRPRRIGAGASPRRRAQSSRVSWKRRALSFAPYDGGASRRVRPATASSFVLASSTTGRAFPLATSPWRCAAHPRSCVARALRQDARQSAASASLLPCWKSPYYTRRACHGAPSQQRRGCRARRCTLVMPDPNRREVLKCKSTPWPSGLTALFG